MSSPSHKQVIEFLDSLAVRTLADGSDLAALKRASALVRFDLLDDSDESAPSGHRGEDFCKGT
jgi:hypothetical protein